MKFKIGFDIRDYKDILPPAPTTLEKVINIEKDNPDDQFWQKLRFPNIITPEFMLGEMERLRQGVWILIKGEPIWIPPNYYQFLQYGNASGEPPQFRLKRLKYLYQKLRVRNNPRFVGTYNIKNRQDGDTTINMSDGLWEVHSGDLDNGMIGIQSKTRADAINPCWFIMQSQWNGYPRFFKDALYPHFASGNNIAEKLQFMQPADPNDPNSLGKNVVIQYGPAVYNAFDGKNNMRRCILDEINKWIECSFRSTFDNYMKFIMPGRQRKGLFDIFSSPADKNGPHNDEAYQFWKDSDPDDIQETGSTKSRVMRIYSNPLDGIEGFYDKFGDADPQEVYEHIMRERRTKSKDKLMGEVRGYPLPIIGTDKPNEEEIFGSTDSHSIWINKSGIAKRRIKIIENKSALVQYGNFEWPNNVQDSGEPVWRPADVNNFDDEVARFCISHTGIPKIPLADFKTPPKAPLIENILGIDPFNLRYETKNKITGSLGAGVVWRCRDLSNTVPPECPILAYLSRPWHKSIFHEDMLLAAVATRSLIQYENTNDDLESYAEDRGYLGWFLVSENAKEVITPEGKKVRRGDAPAGRGASKFINNIVNLINGVTNKPLTPEDIYLLDNFNFEEILEDLLNFSRENAQFNHFTAAFGQALMGRNKLLFQKVRKRDSKNNGMIGHLMS